MPRCWIIVPIQTLPRFVSRGALEIAFEKGTKIPSIFREGKLPKANMATRWGKYIGNKWNYKTITPISRVISENETYLKPPPRWVCNSTYSGYFTPVTHIFSAICTGYNSINL